MLTVIGTWEPGLHTDDVFVEWRMWKNVCRAYAVDRWIMVGIKDQAPGGVCECIETMQDALDSAQGQRIFLIPHERDPIEDIDLFGDDFVFIFGNASENLKRFVTEDDTVAFIDTPKPFDMFAPVACGIVLHECR